MKGKKEENLLCIGYFLGLTRVLCWYLVVKVEEIMGTLKTFTLEWIEYFIFNLIEDNNNKVVILKENVKIHASYIIIEFWRKPLIILLTSMPQNSIPQHV